MYHSNSSPKQCPKEVSEGKRDDRRRMLGVKILTRMPVSHPERPGFGSSSPVHLSAGADPGSSLGGSGDGLGG